MKTWLRQHRYALGATLRRIVQQPFSSLSNLVVMALALTLPLVGASVLTSVQPIVGHLATGPELTVFLKPEVPRTATETLAQRLREQAGDAITDLRIVPREAALQRLQQDPTWAGALDGLNSNPLPDAIVVTLSGPDYATQAQTLAPPWREWREVDHVQLDAAWVQRVQSLIALGQLATLVVAAAVAIAVLAAVFNTVRMQALSQREEINVARLLGATESFVRRPFLYLGAISGGVAATLAIVCSGLLLNMTNPILQRLAATYGTNFALHLPALPWLLLFIAGTALLGAFSALWSVTRNTRD